MITTDRDVFIGGHFTKEQKDQFKVEAARRKMSMSALLSQIVEDWLVVAPDEQVEEIRSNRRTIRLVDKATGIAINLITKHDLSIDPQVFSKVTELLPPISGHQHSFDAAGKTTCGCDLLPLDEVK